MAIREKGRSRQQGGSETIRDSFSLRSRDSTTNLAAYVARECEIEAATWKSHAERRVSATSIGDCGKAWKIIFAESARFHYTFHRRGRRRRRKICYRGIPLRASFSLSFSASFTFFLVDARYTLVSRIRAKVINDDAHLRDHFLLITDRIIII